MITIGLNKQQALDAAPKVIKQIAFIGNVERERAGNSTLFFILEEVKETILGFWQGTMRAL